MQALKRAELLPPYVFSIVDELKQQVEADGTKVTDLGMGNPDQPTPKPIVDALIQAVQDPAQHRYSMPHGILPLRQALTDWYQRRFQVELDPELETIVTIGSKEGLGHLALAAADSESSVLVPAPCYPIHHYGFQLGDSNVISVPFETDEAAYLDNLATQLKTAKPKVKLMMLNFPSNPTSQCVSYDFFVKIIELAKEHECWVVNDLAYADIVFDDRQVPSILQVPGAKDIAVESYSLSKSFNMPGWRVGFVSGNAQLVGALRRMKSYLDYGLFQPVQTAAITALNNAETLVKPICEQYQRRRDVVCESLAKIGWEVPKPQATMFVWAPIPDKYRAAGSLDFAKHLVRNAHVALSPGIGFGPEGDGHMRLSLVAQEATLQQAIEQIGKIL